MNSNIKKTDGDKSFVRQIVRKALPLLTNIVVGIKTYWPLYLLMLFACILEPILVVYGGTGFQYTHMNPMGLLFSFCFALPLQMLFCSSVYFLSGVRKILCTVLSILYMSYIISSIFIYIKFKSIWNRIYYDLIAFTVKDEVIGFFIAFWEWLIFGILLYAVAVYFIIQYFRKVKALTSRINYVCGSIFIIPAVILILFTAAAGGHFSGAWYSLFHKPIAIRGAFEYFTDDVTNNLAETFRNLQKNMIMPNGVKRNFENVTGIVLVGESITRGHMSVYGYSRDTTPNLLKRKNEWICYPDAISSFQVTVVSCMCMFTDMHCCTDIPRLSIPLLFRNIPGCTVNYFSKQSKSDVELGRLFFPCNNVQYVDGLVKNRKSYDEDLLIPLRKNIGVQGTNLYILQFMGSHFPSFLNFPQRYSVFGEDEHVQRTALAGNLKKRMQCGDSVNQYDNSIFYSDHVIESIIQLCEKQKQPFWVLLLSDHGESPGGAIRNPREKSTWEIPFCFWFNKSFREKYPDIVRAVQANVNQPVQTSCVYEVICYLMGISYDEFPYNRIPFHPSYIPPERMMGDKKYVK